MDTKERFNYDALLDIGTNLLRAIGEDPTREGLKDTPRRFASAWKEFIEYDPGNHVTTFETIQTDQMIIVKNMQVWSMCEHHLMPFWCRLSVGYIATNKILGLSKFGRIAQMHAHRLQLQERLVDDVAKTVIETTGSENVGVIGMGEHLCMTMRGIQMQSEMISSSLHGVFKTLPEARAEFMSFVTAR